MKEHPEIIQGSEEWERARRVRITATKFERLITPVKGDLSTASRSLLINVIQQQRWKDDPDPAVKWTGNANTDNGNEREPHARALLAEILGIEIGTMGFVTSDDGLFGCSPDGWIRGSDGKALAGAELKAPTSAVHAEYVYYGVLPKEYRVQVHASMAITGLRTWHFLSYGLETAPLHLVCQWDDFTEKVAAAANEAREMYLEMREPLLAKLNPGKHQPFFDKLRIGAGEEAA